MIKSDLRRFKPEDRPGLQAQAEISTFGTYDFDTKEDGLFPKSTIALLQTSNESN